MSGGKSPDGPSVDQESVLARLAIESPGELRDRLAARTIVLVSIRQERDALAAENKRLLAALEDALSCAEGAEGAGVGSKSAALRTISRLCCAAIASARARGDS